MHKSRVGKILQCSAIVCKTRANSCHTGSGRERRGEKKEKEKARKSSLLKKGEFNTPQLINSESLAKGKVFVSSFVLNAKNGTCLPAVGFLFAWAILKVKQEAAKSNK